MFLLSMIVLGFGGAFLSTTPASMVGDVIKGRGGKVIAIFQMAGDAGMIFGPIIIGWISDVYSYKAAFGYELRERAPAVGMNPEEVPDITWVAQPSDLSCVDEHFGVVLSSHAIEHQPDLVHHLNQVDQILKRGGRYFVLVPDHRYCFDHFMTPSTITDVLAAHLDKRVSHATESLLESRLLMTHNDPIEHWKGNHGDPAHNPEYPNSDRIDRLHIAMRNYLEDNGVIKNEHAWYFTPDTFQSIIQDLNNLGLIKLRIERMYPSMLNSGEFWTILRSES
jgi:SAM-dependent methyltransferase